jgi:Putative beta-barrel porin-2, OmpL-like. bbp2
MARRHLLPQVQRDVRIGRFVSIPDIEAQLAPNNYTYTHSLTYIYDNFTNTGILGTLAVTKNWIVQLGVVASHEYRVPNLVTSVKTASPLVYCRSKIGDSLIRRILIGVVAAAKGRR